MQFHDKDRVISQDAPTKVFLQARAVTLFLYTQKNSVRSDSTTMKVTNLKHSSPGSAAAQHFLHLRQHNLDPDTTI